jgi:O-antigen ligase
LESFFGSNPLIDLLPTVLLTYGVSRYAFVGGGDVYIGKHWDKRNIALFAAYFAYFLFALARINGTSADDGTVGLINTLVKQVLFVVFCYLYFSKEFKYSTDVRQTVTKLFAVIVVSMAIDYVFWLLIYVFAHGAGEQMEEIEYNFILSLMGIQFEKKLIPIVKVHPNTIGMYCGAAVAMLLVFFLSVKKSLLPKRMLRLLQIALGAGLIFVFIVDSRGTLLNALVLAPGIVFFAARYRKLSLVKYFVLLVPALPFLMLYTLSFLADTGVGSQFSREGENLATANNRSTIWEACVNELVDAKPVHFWGYGTNGQVAAGIDVYYNQFFAVKGMIVHNAFFQTVLDMGYLGTALFLVVLFVVMRNAQVLYKKGVDAGLCFLSFFVCYLAAGTTESTHGVYNQTYTTCMFAVAMLVMTAYNELKETDSDSLENSAEEAQQVKHFA